MRFGMKFIGYARIEKEDHQEELSQQLHELGLSTKDIHFDIYHGDDFKGPELVKILLQLNPNTCLIVPELKTITKNINEILKFIHLTEIKRYNVIAIREGINTTRDSGKEFLHIMNDFYESYLTNDDSMTIKAEKKEQKDNKEHKK